MSDLGLTGARNMSGFYLDGIRQKDRIANAQVVDELESRIRAKANLLDKSKKIEVKQLD